MGALESERAVKHKNKDWKNEKYAMTRHSKSPTACEKEARG